MFEYYIFNIRMIKGVYSGNNGIKKNKSQVIDSN